MYSVKDNPYNYSLPPQRVATSKKTKDWQHASVDAIINLSTQTITNNRSSKYTKQINYNLYNSIFDEKDFNYILNPFGLQGKYSNVATKMENYNIIRSKIELLKGEEMSRPFNFMVRAINGEVVSQKHDEKRQAILEHLQGLILDQEAEPLEEIEKYFKTKYIHPREVTANQILEYGIHSERLISKFNEGWEHALLSSEEVYYVGTHNNEPKVRVVNPINFDYDKTIELRNIEDAQWAKEERWLAVGEILDLYGEYLTSDEVSRLDKGEIGYPVNKMNYYPGFAYNMSEMEAKNSTSQYSYNGNRTGSHVYVANVVWKSMRKIGFLSYIDPRTGQIEETLVDEEFKMVPELEDVGAILRWQWINEVWEGTRIGEDIYVHIRPLPNQFRDLNNPGQAKLPYIGYVYNSVNSMSTSMVDLIKPHQYTYMIVWWRLKQELAKAKGKKLIMDWAKLPRSMGMDMDQWTYYFENQGVIWINSMEEGRKGDPNSVSQYNQMTQIDMSVSESVKVYLEILREIEDQIDRITGISRQREANISTSETVGGIERAIQQSNNITEPWFSVHNDVKQKVLNAYLYNFRQTSNENKKVQYIVNDVETSILEVDGSEFDDTNYNTFVTNSIKDNKIKQKLEGLANIALQQEKVKFSDIIRIFKSESISEIESKIIQSEQEFDQNIAAQNKAQQEVEANNAEATRQHESDLQDREDYQKELDRENKLQIAILTSLGFSQDTDVNANGIPDIIEQGKLALQQGQQSFQRFVDSNRLAIDAKKNKSDAALKQRELDIKEKEIKSKEKMNTENNKTALKNKVVGEKTRKK